MQHPTLIELGQDRPGPLKRRMARAKVPSPNGRSTQCAVERFHPIAVTGVRLLTAERSHEVDLRRHRHFFGDQLKRVIDARRRAQEYPAHIALRPGEIFPLCFRFCGDLHEVLATFRSTRSDNGNHLAVRYRRRERGADRSEHDRGCRRAYVGISESQKLFGGGPRTTGHEVRRLNRARRKVPIASLCDLTAHGAEVLSHFAGRCRSTEPCRV